MNNDTRIAVSRLQSRNTELRRNIKDAMKANSILRAAMYDIMEYDADGDEMAYCGQQALKALDASALDEQGRIAKPHNDES